jgi:flavorubredoxin
MTVTEISPDVFRISIYVPQFNLQFNHFLIRDEEPMLFHTGMRGMFPALRDAVTKLIPPDSLRWIGFSHFEVDECGALNEWLSIAPSAEPVCSLVGAMVNLADFSDRPARGLTKDTVLETGRCRFRYIPTPHLPHGWDAGVMLEETSGTLFCSDLFHQNGDVQATTDKDILGLTRESMKAMQASPLMDYMPYTPRTGDRLKELAALKPRALAAMHGSTYHGNCEKALLELGGIMKEVLS